MSNSDGGLKTKDPKTQSESSKKLEMVLYAQKYLEYKNDPIKFMEECIHIPTPGGSTLIKLYEPQKRIVESFLKNHDLILLKSRQIGMSTICQAIITYIFTFYKNCVVGIVSRDAAEASDFLSHCPAEKRDRNFSNIKGFTLFLLAET